MDRMDSAMCNHILNNFVPYWRGYTSLSGGDFIDCLEECFICIECGKVYTEAEFDAVLDKPLEDALVDISLPGAHHA